MAKIKGVFLPDFVTIASDVSPDQQATTVIIEKLSVALGDIPGPLTVTRTATIHVPLAESEDEVTINQHVRGFVSIRPGARGLLIVQGGGKTVQVELPTGDPSGSDFLNSSTITLSKGAPYQVTFFLLVERDKDDPAIGGYIQVDTLDLEIQPTPKGKY